MAIDINLNSKIRTGQLITYEIKLIPQLPLCQFKNRFISKQVR